MNVKIYSLAATVALAAVAAPAFALTCPKEGSKTLQCGSYWVSNQYATNKRSSQNAGNWRVTWLAVGMIETSTLDSNYTYGDGKSGDSANFGYMKDNWYSYRTAVSNFRGQSSSQWNNGAIANGNYGNAQNFANQIVSYFGWTGYWEVHRGGQSRLGVWNSDTDEYYQGVNWIQQQINSNYGQYTTDGTRFWVSVPAI